MEASTSVGRPGKNDECVKVSTVVSAEVGDRELTPAPDTVVLLQVIVRCRPLSQLELSQGHQRYGSGEYSVAN